MIPFLVGAVAGMAVVGASGRASSPTAAQVRPQCGTSLVLFRPAGPVGRAIDRATRRRGFSHVAIDGCEVDGHGHRVLFDCAPTMGVHRRRLANYRGRTRTRVWLPLAVGREVRGCARGMLGRPYSLSRLVGLQDLGQICSEFVMSCLPQPLSSRIRLRYGETVSPNDLAHFFGAVPGGPDVAFEEKSS